MRQLKKLNTLVLGWMLVLGTVTAQDYFGGNGSETFPYLIYTTGDLQTLGATPADWDKHFRLITDLDMTGKAMTPIGNDPTPFTGTFDGSEFAISNLTINLPTTDYVGLFGSIHCTYDTGISDLGLINANITGDYRVGGLVGEYHAGKISNCYVTGTVNGRSNVGGLVGWAWGGRTHNCYTNTTTSGGSRVGGLMGGNKGWIKNCYAIGIVNGGTEGDILGGLVGGNYYGTIDDSYATGTVSGDFTVGGLAGENTGHIHRCYATGTVRGSVGGGAFNAGGLVALNNVQPNNDPDRISEISDCYATGNVSGGFSVGGLVGRVDFSSDGSSVIRNSYATGAVNGFNRVGGLLGQNYSSDSSPSEIKYCYATGAVNVLTMPEDLWGLRIRMMSISSVSGIQRPIRRSLDSAAVLTLM